MTRFRFLALVPALCACLALSARAQLASNQTNGFGNNNLLVFTYLQSFDCVDQPLMDLDFNGILAENDPNEMQTPICQPGTEPSIDPTGGDIKHTLKLHVLVPMFSVDNDNNPNDAMACPTLRPGELCGPALGMALIQFFGFIPEAWKEHPLVPTQCPNVNHPMPATCPMHASSVDMSLTLNALGKIGKPTAPVYVPTPNHSHVTDNAGVNAGPSWWEVRPVLVMNQADWPAADATSGLVSATAVANAEAAGRAIEAPSNFFLFFAAGMAMPGGN